MKQFVHGGRAKLSELAAINHIWEVGVGIDAPFYIIDFCCFGLDENGRVVDEGFLISYNNPDSPSGAISLNNASNNAALFTIYLERLPSSIRRLVFTATLEQSLAPRGILGAAFSFLGATSELGAGHLTLGTPAVEAGFFEFSGQDFAGQATLIVGEIYWRDEWRFVAAAQPLREDLDVFLRRLSDGPTPAPQVRQTSPVNRAPVIAPLPPRPAAPQKSAQAPAPVRPPIPAAPRTPVAAQSRPTSPPAPPTPAPRAPIQPVAASIPPVAAPVQRASPPVFVPDAKLLPQSVPPGGRLQDLIDAAAPGSTLILMSDEYEGPLTISKPLSLEGRDSAIWMRQGPVVTVSSTGVTLRDLDIEVTVARATNDATSVALKVEDAAGRVQLYNVRVTGHIDGLGDEDGEWILPSRLDLGQFAPRVENSFTFSISVPTQVQISSPVEGVTISPSQVEAGQHTITLKVRDILPDAILVGSVEIQTAWLTRTVPLSGGALAGESAKVGVAL